MLRFWIGTTWHIALANVSAICITPELKPEDEEYDADDPEQNAMQVEIYLEGDSTSITLEGNDAQSFLETWDLYTLPGQPQANQAAAQKMTPQEEEALRTLAQVGQQFSGAYDSEHKRRIDLAIETALRMVHRLR